MAINPIGTFILSTLLFSNSLTAAEPLEGLDTSLFEIATQTGEELFEKSALDGEFLSFLEKENGREALEQMNSDELLDLLAESGNKDLDRDGISLLLQEGSQQINLEQMLEREEAGEKQLNIEPIFLETQKEVLAGEKVGINTTKETKNAVNGKIHFAQVFAGAPIIYSLLGVLSVATLTIWLYSLLSLNLSKGIKKIKAEQIREQLQKAHFEKAAQLCEENNSVLSLMLAKGIRAHEHTLQQLREEAMQEGRRLTMPFWQKIGLLSDIAVIAPMLGLLGTVLGMFYAFYNLNRSQESVATLFDGLGVSVGTTVAGLFVAIFAMILHSVSKYKLTSFLVNMEREVEGYLPLIKKQKAKE